MKRPPPGPPLDVRAVLEASPEEARTWLALYRELGGTAELALDRMIEMGAWMPGAGREIQRADIGPLREWAAHLGRRREAWSRTLGELGEHELRSHPTVVHLASTDVQGALTRRETSVLKEIRAGRTNREIAYLLGISTTTVNKHVHHILRKLNARNRAQAATMSGPTGSLAQVGGDPVADSLP